MRNANQYYGFEALIGWGQIGFKGNFLPFIPIRSMKLSAGYQILFGTREENGVVDQGIEFKIAIGYKHKRSNSEGVKIYSN